MTRHIPKSQWTRLSGLIAQTMGLHFPAQRFDDLQRGFSGAALEFGFEDAATCLDHLLATTPSPAQLQVLASHLTIGETYFFRDRDTLDALAANILPDLIQTRRRERRLRLWSAACSSGEEAYSLAILLHRLLPDLDEWRVSITATDINPRMLDKAAAGVYGEWSFRHAPVGLKQRYFKQTADGRFAISPAIKKMVTFAHLNLVEDVYPMVRTDTHAMDVILCRNVMIYFTPPQISKVISGLHDSLVDGGWLAVSPSEASQALFRKFETVNFSGATLYRKDTGKDAAITPRVAPAALLQADSENDSPDRTATRAIAGTRANEDRAAPRSGTRSAVDSRPVPIPPTDLQQARALANQGLLDDALARCERWIGVAKLDPAGHYLRAMVLLEQGDPAQARASLQRTLYLEQDFVLAHFALGNLARDRGDAADASRHFTNALTLLRQYQPHDALPDSDGLTAGRLAAALTTMLADGESR